MNITKHEAVPIVATASNVHGEVVNVPVPLVVKPTVPVGVIGVPTSLSVTVAIHVVIDPVLRDDGLHATVVVVFRTKSKKIWNRLPS